MPESILSRYLDPVALGRMGQWPLAPRDLVIGNLAGSHKSPLSGFAVEFAGHREYAPGDDPKHVDWRVYFTRDKYFVKQYELETNFVCHLLLDVSASMRYGEGAEQKLLYAGQMASMLAWSIVHQSDKVSLATFDSRVRAVLPPSNSPHQVVQMTQHLDSISPVEKTDIEETLGDLAGRLQRRQIVMIFSDFFADLGAIERAIQRMRYNKHEVVLFQIAHHDELAFEFDGMVKFVGLEAPEEMLAQPDELRRSYLAAVKDFNDKLEQLAERNRCERVLVDTRRPIGETLIDYLSRRSHRPIGRG
jgi:uncharacterized protein (DUF58 family)